MQTLWSRAALAPSSCRCRMCLHSANALSRRATTAAPRRKITVADLFTACYTTILGTATIIDSRRKREKRQELDRELERARAALHKLAVASPRSALDGENGVLDGETSTTSQLVRDITSRSANEPARPLLKELQSLCDMKYRPVDSPPWMSDQFDWASIEAAVAAEEQDPDIVLLEPLTDLNLAETTATVQDLVEELLRCTETPPSQPPQDQPDIPDPAGDAILRELDDLRYGPEYPGYQSPAVDPEYTTYVRARLNESIRLIFDQAVTLREAVGRICYNLLAVGVPPTIHTYNILVTGFNRIQRQDLAGTVINSYLCRTSWPATDQTVVCLLAHYRRPGGREGMRDAVQRIWGARIEGLHLATLERDLNNLPRPTLKRKPTLQKGRAILLVKRDDATFDHLIRGWLYHNELDFACMSFVACLRNGSSIPIHTLQELFRGCLATADFANARKLLTGISRNFENFSQYLSNVIGHNTTATVQELLQSLCQIIDICWLPIGEIYGETHQTFASAAVALNAMMKRLDVQLEVKETARIPTLLSDALHSNEPLLTRLELAIYSLDSIKLIKRTAAIYEDSYIRIARVMSIDRRCRDLDERTQNLVAAYNAAIISIKTGYDIDARSLLLTDLDELNNNPTADNKRLALSRALGQLTVGDGHLTIDEVASQLFRQIPNPNLIRQLEGNDNWKRLSIPVLVSFFGDNAASRPAVEGKKGQFDNLYEQLRAQIREARDSVRALVFTHVSEKTQSRGMSHYGGYYSIPLWRLRSHLHRELKHQLPWVLQDFPKYKQPAVTYDRSQPLFQSGPDRLTIRNRAIPFKSDGSALDVRHDLTTNGWRKPRRHHQEHESWSMPRNEEPWVRLDHASIG
ncbi:hypothetical protein F4859DRAFT_142523 [Xylaria cf. heliscus]|nr:hypothetical protein F4859DRAFT_142523 [Xylaria cf. heliscus]